MLLVNYNIIIYYHIISVIYSDITYYHIIFYIPHAPCMAYLPTLSFLGQMLIHIPYMVHIIYIQYNYMYILSLFNKTFMIIIYIYIVINITLYVMI